MSGGSDFIIDAINEQRGVDSPGTYYTGNSIGGFGGGTYSPGEPYTPHYLSISGGKHSATNNQAHLARAEYEDYKRRFVPIENELIDQIGDRSVYAQNAQRGVNAVDQAYGTTAGEYQRGLSRYGVKPTNEQMEGQQRQMGLAQAAAEAQAANSARTAVKNREMTIMAGGLAPQKPQVGQ